jgi:hypothetical protein
MVSVLAARAAPEKSAESSSATAAPRKNRCV